MRNYIHIILSVFILMTSCEEVIEVDLPNPEGKLVIEGEMNSGLPAIVNLSYNMAYFDPIDSAALADMFITDSSALLTVTDGENIDTLQLTNITKFPYVAYVGTSVVGEVGKTYTLIVEYKGKRYQAQTSIPEPASISNIWFEEEMQNDSIGMLSLSIHDDGRENNYYALSIMVIGEQWWYYHPIFGVPVFDDIRFNGDSTVAYIPRSYAGNDFASNYPETDEGWDSLYYYRIGENVSLRLSTIDQEFYLWWNSFFRSGFTGSNPYSNPSSILTNIEGDPALGVWGGYANTIANFHISDSGTIEELRLEDFIPELLSDSTQHLIRDFQNENIIQTDVF